MPTMQTAVWYALRGGIIECEPALVGLGVQVLVGRRADRGQLCFPPGGVPGALKGRTPPSASVYQCRHLSQVLGGLFA